MTFTPGQELQAGFDRKTSEIAGTISFVFEEIAFDQIININNLEIGK